MKKNYIIYAPPFNENIGGSIALHKLCDLLNSIGEQAYLWKALEKPTFKFRAPIKSTYNLLRYLVHKYYEKYEIFALFNTPIANKKALKNSIVIYPEVVNGNPLKAKNIVRWFLHKPGFHTGQINFGQNELYFYYQNAFNDDIINVYPDNKLMVLFIRDDIYKQTNFMEREGICYLIRKGKKKPIVHDMTNSICIDGMSHMEISVVFNKMEYFISYDTHTMYQIYALMCGCKVIVIPDEGITKEIWQPIQELRDGISYGMNDIEVSEKNKSKLFDYLRKEEKNSYNSAQVFVSKCEFFFNKK